MSPTTQAAPAISPFMSSMLAAGLMEMPPVSKQTPFPMKATGASPALPPFQRITTTRLSRTEPCPTPSNAFIPSFFIALMSSTSTATRSFLSAFDRRANSSGKRTLAGSLTKSRANKTPSEIAARGSNALRAAATSPTATVTCTRRRRLFVVLAFGLVTVERVSAQAHALCKIGGLLWLHRSTRQFGENRGIAGGVRQLAHGKATRTLGNPSA